MSKNPYVPVWFGKISNKYSKARIQIIKNNKYLVWGLRDYPKCKNSAAFELGITFSLKRCLFVNIHTFNDLVFFD